MFYQQYPEKSLDSVNCLIIDASFKGTKRTHHSEF